MAKRARDLGRLGGDGGGCGQSEREAGPQKVSEAAAEPASRQDRSYSEPRRSSTRRSRRTIEITQPRMRSQTMAYATKTCQ